MKNKFSMKHIAFLFTISILAHNCNDPVIQKPEELSLPELNYHGKELRIDGYWYWKDSYDGVTRYRQNYFFYRNGVMLGGISFEESELEEKEESFRNGEFHKFASENKYCWGRFIVEDSIIKFEKWYPSYPPYPVFTVEGRIINDTTFNAFRSYRIKDGEIYEESEKDETYHFRFLRPKPDSTNTFIE